VLNPAPVIQFPISGELNEIHQVERKIEKKTKPYETQTFSLKKYFLSTGCLSSFPPENQLQRKV
jgi:hypothetical protein